MVMVCQKDRMPMTILSLYILFGRGRNWSHPSSDWFFFLVSDWLMDIGFCHLIDQISWLVIVWWSDRKFSKLKTLYRWCSLVSWCCNLLCHWLVSLQSDWLIGRKWRLLISQISWLLIGWWWSTSQSFFHSDYRLSRRHRLDPCIQQNRSVWTQTIHTVIQH